MLKNVFPSPRDMYDREIFFPGMETTIYYFYIWASFLALPLLSGGGGGMCVCVCVCERDRHTQRERERERERERKN